MSVMSVTLETLPLFISQQYSELPWESHLSTKEWQLEVDNSAIIVSIAMDRIQNWIPKAEIIYKGKIFTNVAIVKISPPNEQVIQAVANHFKNQVMPNPLENNQDEPLFALVAINLSGLLMQLVP